MTASFTQKLINVTPYSLYLRQVQDTSDGIRSAYTDTTYYPVQFGGLLGQAQVLASNVTLSITDFDTTNG